ncbi:hypothetical protein HMPREF3185_00200 [Porphyromonas somerae]|uniref:Uncharacterized protein n=1 Tax=Porphyromonas somerae TaxID=322095 RepID=A0A134BEE5_9PORP|nr:hypothetical protein HMPREF3184_00200 [Porphyromonadaceae bacterium KA00676]KXB78322.1 hypothetical protein HMPREF3185_00200 [Porphyromonas somerae]
MSADDYCFTHVPIVVCMACSHIPLQSLSPSHCRLWRNLLRILVIYLHS